jgi:hypothetical protein
MVHARADFADVHLHPITRHGAARAELASDPPPRRREHLLAVTDEQAVDGVERQRQIVLTDEFIAELLDPELAVASEAEDQRLVLCKHLLSCQASRTAAPFHQATWTSGLIPVPPLAQRRA